MNDPNIIKAIEQIASNVNVLSIVIPLVISLIGLAIVIAILSKR